MHIAFLTPEYPHPQLSRSGGLGTSIRNLAMRLAQEKVRVTVVVYGQERDAVFVEKQITFHCIRQHKHSFLGFYHYRKFLEKYLNRLAVTEKIDLIEAPDWTGITAFMKLDVPLIIRFHGSDGYFCKLEGRKQKFKNRLFEQLALKNTDVLVSVSAFTAKITAQLFKLNPEIAVIPNSVDVEVFKPVPDKEMPDRVLYFGTLIRKKGVLELAEILNQVHKERPQTRFVFAGKDVVDIFTQQSTKQLIKDAMTPETLSQTDFLDELPYSVILDEIAKATVVVLPSFAEALPMTWLESMAMEKALVTSDIGWAKEVMIHGETGYMASPNEHAVYAKHILELLQDAGLRKKMGVQARKRVVEKFSSEVVTQQNMDFYKNCLKHHANT